MPILPRPFFWGQSRQPDGPCRSFTGDVLNVPISDAVAMRHFVRIGGGLPDQTNTAADVQIT